MNRKLVNGLLLLTLATGGTSLFTSCKDTDEDYRNEIFKNQKEILDVYKEIYEASKKLPQEVQDMINKELYETNPDGSLKLDANNQPIPKYAKATDVEALDKILNGDGTDKGLIDKVNNINSALFGEDGVSGILGDIKNLQDAINEEGGIDDQLEAIRGRLDELEKKECPDNSEEIETLKKILEGDGTPENPGLIQQFKDMSEDIYGDGTEENPGIKKTVEDLKNAFDEISTLIDSLGEQVKALMDDVNARIDELITSIELHQTWNPIFGSFNYPVGLSSSIVGAYYGEALEDVVFPLQVKDYPNADVAGTESALLKIDQAALANLISGLTDKVEIKAGVPYYNDEAENNMGQIYLTVNPFNPSAERNVTYSLVNSQDEAAPAITIDVKDTDEVLSFGYKTRADNGFYRADVNTTDPTAEGLKIEISSDLKSAMKDALKSPSKSDLASLAKILYDEMQKGLTAYAVKATWSHTGKELSKTEDGKEYTVTDKAPQEYSVISKYDIAAATFKPLGYASLDYNLTNKFHFPTYNGTLKDAIDKVFDSFNINFELDLEGVAKLDPKEFTIDLSSALISFNEESIMIDLSGLPLNIDGVENAEIGEGAVITLKYDPSIGKVDAGDITNDNALNNLLLTISDKINGMLSSDDANDPGIQQQINDLLQNKVVGQVNSMIDTINNMLVGDGTPGSGMNAQIQSNIDKIISNIKDNILGKLGKAESLLNKYNKIASKLNKMLSDPNHFLQVMAAYQDGNKDLHTLSTSLHMPSFFQKGALEIYVTSYTSEIIAPSYKKYVAVANVYDKKTFKPVADFAAEVNKVNGANEFLNKLVPGHVQSVALDASSLNSDYIYELVYTSLDYRGKTSSQLYYFTVGK